MEICDDQMLQRRPDMLFSSIDDEVVMMSVESGEYYGLNAVASRIWELLELPCTFGHLLNQLLREFDIDEETCRRDVLVFLDRMLKKDLIVMQ